jgi:ribonuclease HII
MEWEGIIPSSSKMDTFEKLAYERGYRLIAGVDEAGRGPLAGPVAAAAVIFPPDYFNHQINDSVNITFRINQSRYF